MLDERTLIELSALHDGELDAARAREMSEKLAADAKLRRELEVFARLDKTAAALPTPQRDKQLAEIWKTVALAAEQDEVTAVEKAVSVERIPNITESRYAQVWKKIAEQTIAPSQKTQDAMLVSALSDGEVDADQRQRADVILKQNPAFSRDQLIWKKLAEAASALPVPQMDKVAASEGWHQIAEQTVRVSDADRRDFAKIEAAAKALPVPVPDAAAFEKVWSAVASRQFTEQQAAAENVPQISNARWNKVWGEISRQVQPKASETAPKPAPSPKVVPVDFSRQKTERRRWRWFVAASMAAAVLVSVFSFLHETSVDEPEVAVQVPEVIDDRYNVQVKYLEGQEEPVVCFFLNENKEENRVQNFQWLPD